MLLVVDCWCSLLFGAGCWMLVVGFCWLLLLLVAVAVGCCWLMLAVVVGRCWLLLVVAADVGVDAGVWRGAINVVW